MLHDMAVTANVYNAVHKLRHAKGKDIHSLTAPERNLLKALQDEDMI
jgi:DNA-binding SARP family transcriptional activator